MIKVVPQAFFGAEQVYPRLSHDGEACILYKSLDTPPLQSDYFVSSHVFTIVLKGSKELRPFDGPVVRVKEGSGVFIPRDLYMIQDILPDGGGHFESWLFFFPDRVVQDFLSSLQKGSTALPHLKEQPGFSLFAYDEKLRLFSQSLQPLFEESVNIDRAYLRLKLQELLHLLASGPERETFIKQLARLRPHKRNIAQLMESYFDKALRVEDYALLSGRSLSSFMREFKQAFGTTPKQWLMLRRMEKAAQLLREGAGDVTGIALSVGYENLSHFIKAFRDHYGHSPKQYMKAHRDAGLF